MSQVLKTHKTAIISGRTAFQPSCTNSSRSPLKALHIDPGAAYTQYGRVCISLVFAASRVFCMLTKFFFFAQERTAPHGRQGRSLGTFSVVVVKYYMLAKIKGRSADCPLGRDENHQTLGTSLPDNSNRLDRGDGCRWRPGDHQLLPLPRGRDAGGLAF